MKKMIMAMLLISLTSGCASTNDLAQTLRYSDNNPVGVENIEFRELNTMKRGEACTWNIFYFLPLQGDGSIITAANNGDINNVELIGKTGSWYFPFSRNCTVVFGDNNMQKQHMTHN